jgi:hypothetical protein
MSWGWFELASRLLKFNVTVLVVVNTKSYVPFPVISDVTSTLVQLPAAKFPDEPMREPREGMLTYVIVPSSQA